MEILMNVVKATTALVLTLFLLCLSLGSDSKAAEGKKESFSPDFFVNLHFHEGSFLNPDVVIKTCSELLQRKDQLSGAQVAAALEHRGWAYVGKNQHSAAVEDFKEVLRMRPKDPEIQWYLANCLMREGSKKQAHDMLVTLIKTHPKFPSAYGTLALKCALEHDYGKAIELATTGITIDEKLLTAYSAKAIAYYGLAKYSKALEEIERCIIIDPVAARPPETFYYLRARILNDMGRHQSALDSLQIAMKLANGSASRTIKDELWKAYHGLGNYHVSAFLGEERAMENGKDHMSWYYCGLSRFATMRQDAAMEAARMAKKTDPEGPDCYIISALYHYAHGDYPNANTDILKTSEIAPKNADAAALRVIFLTCCPEVKYRNGRQASKLAEQLSGNFEDKQPAFLMLLGIACGECGDYDNAVGICEKAINLLESTSRKKVKYEEILSVIKEKKPWHTNKDVHYLMP